MKKVFALLAVVSALAVAGFAGSASAAPKPGNPCLFYVDQASSDLFVLYPTLREALRAADRYGWTYIGTETIC